MDTKQPYLPPRCREAYSGHPIEVQANYRSAQTFRIEELVRDNNYVIRAELPGLDPAKDIEVTVDG
jgi:HSP20 family protein